MKSKNNKTEKNNNNKIKQETEKNDIQVRNAPRSVVFFYQVLTKTINQGKFLVSIKLFLAIFGSLFCNSTKVSCNVSKTNFFS